MREFFRNPIARFVAIIVVVYATLFAVTNARASDMQTIANATFKLYEGNEGMCSTTFLRNDKDGALFLTAAHCVDGQNLNVRRQIIDQKDLSTVLSETVYYVKPVRTLTRKDIALLQTLDKTAFFAEDQVDIATVEEANKLRIGDLLMVSGYPAAEALAISTGEFTGKVPAILGWDSPVYQTTVPVAGGNSGGAIYARIEDTWKLIGTTSAMRRDNSIMTYFQTAETVKEVLTGYINNTSVMPTPVLNKNTNLRIDER